MKQSVTVGAQLLWGGRYGCNKGCYGCTIVMSYIEINKALSQWLLTFNLCVSVTWPLTCAFHIPCTHTPEIIDMHRGVCDNITAWMSFSQRISQLCGIQTIIIDEKIKILLPHTEPHYHHAAYRFSELIYQNTTAWHCKTNPDCSPSIWLYIEIYA